MGNLLDHIPAVPLLDGLDHWPATATRQQYFEPTRELVADTVARMDLEPDAEAEVIAAFTAAGLL